MSTISWNGSLDENWLNAGNWTPDQVPASGTTASVGVATPGTVTESFGATSVTLPVDGPVYSSASLDDQVIALQGSGAAAPTLNFVPFDDDMLDIGAGVTIAELGQNDAVDFLSVGTQAPFFDVAGTIESHAAGTLSLSAESYTFSYGTLQLSGTVAASSGGEVDIAPVQAEIVATDAIGDSDTLAPDLIINQGLIQADPGGTIVLDPNVAAGVFVNTGAVVANGGTVLINIDVGATAPTGMGSDSAGSLNIADGGGIYLVSANDVIGEYVTFAGSGTLSLASQDDAVASVAGLVDFAPGDTLELPANQLGSLSDSDDTLSFSRINATGATYTASETIVTTTGETDFVVTEDGSGITLACYARGTRVLTDQGEIAVEHLRIGQQAITATGDRRPIRWLGHRAVDCRHHPRPVQVWPIRILAHAFGCGLPARDLDLSPDHAVLCEGVLVPVHRLVNGCTVMQIALDQIEYWHIELDRHDILLADGLPVESYLDTGNRAAFGGAKLVPLHPSFAADHAAYLTWEATGYAPLRIDGPAIERAMASLRRQAARLGHAPVAAARAPVIRRAPVSDLAALLQPRWYLANHPDVAASGIAPLMHYFRWGHEEARLPCPAPDLLRGLGMIDPGILPFVMADVIAADIDPAEHYCTLGGQEGRCVSLYFDAAWYRAVNDVPTDADPLLHYLLRGESAGKAPSRHFDPAWYRRRYHLKATQSALAHYLARRGSWHVSPNAFFDLESYLRANAARLPSGRDPYLCFLAAGGRPIAAECRAVAASASFG